MNRSSTGAACMIVAILVLVTGCNGKTGPSGRTPSPRPSSTGSGTATSSAIPLSLALTPTWSPDGKYLLFGLDPPGELGFVDNPPENGLFVTRADASDLTPVLISSDFKREPDWTAR